MFPQNLQVIALCSVMVQTEFGPPIVWRSVVGSIVVFVHYATESKKRGHTSSSSVVTLLGFGDLSLRSLGYITSTFPIGILMNPSRSGGSSVPMTETRIGMPCPLSSCSPLGPFGTSEMLGYFGKNLRHRLFSSKPSLVRQSYGLLPAPRS